MTDDMVFTINLTALVVAGVVTVVLTPAVRALAIRWKVGDKPNGRKIHVRMIPHLGGIALVLGVSLALALASWISGGAGGWSEFAARAAPGFILIVGLGLVDDMKSLRALQKLTIQLLAAMLLALAGFHLYTGLAVVDGTPVALWAVSVLFLVGMSSAVNLIDGHDGLAAGVCAISGLGFAVVATAVGSGMLTAVSLALVGACAGFLVFNFPPGRIYMGDTGSMFLGTVLALVACGLTIVKPSLHMFLGVCFILAVPILDALLAIARRFALHAPVFRADSLHVHHVLRQSGFSQRQTIAILCPLQAIFTVLGVAAAMGFVVPIVGGALATVVVFWSFLRMMIAVRASGGRVVPDIAPTSVPLKRTQSDFPRQTGSMGR